MNSFEELVVHVDDFTLNTLVLQFLKQFQRSHSSNSVLSFSLVIEASEAGRKRFSPHFGFGEVDL